MLRGHIEKVAFSGGPYLLMEVEESLGLLASALTFTVASWRKFQI